MDRSEQSALTDDEANLYDRQIRLWGIESQKRLRSANVLIIGMHGLGCEVAKNLILSGIKSMTLLDDGIISDEEPIKQFLIKYDAAGVNRAEASIERCRQLNPMVKITADVNNVRSKPDSFFSSFDVVFATKTSISQLDRIDAACRANNTPFFCGDVFGMFGYMFLDLNVHTFALDIATFVDGVKENVTSKSTYNYASFQDSFNVDWKSEKYAKKMKTMDPCYFLMKVLLRFRGEEGRDPRPHLRKEDIDTLRLLCSKELTQLDVPVDKIPDELLTQTIAEVTPICAIMGGITSQEIIKAITLKDPPVDNFFFFNPMKCVGFADHISTLPDPE